MSLLPFKRLRRAIFWSLVLAVVLVGYVGVTFVQVVVASRGDADGPVDAIVVLGAAQYDGDPSPVLQARLDHAADLYAEGVADVVVVTGGSRPGDTSTEASAAAGYLHERGVPDSALRREVLGSNSWQSLAAAARILREEGRTTAVLVSSPYHALRTEHIAGEVGLDAEASPTRTSPDGGFDDLGNYGRETVAVAVGRIVGYRRLVRLDGVRALGAGR